MIEKYFSITCNNCGSNDTYLTSWDRSFDQNIIEIKCHNCEQTVVDDELIKKGN